MAGLTQPWAYSTFTPDGYEYDNKRKQDLFYAQKGAEIGSLWADSGLANAQAFATNSGAQNANRMAPIQEAMARQKLGMFKDIYGKVLGNMNFSANSRGGYGYTPMPNYVGTQGVFTPQDIQNQVNLGWAQTQAGAANANRGYANSAASRGFSPMSPSVAFMENVNNWRANAAAMANETQFRTQAAQSNRDATLRAQGINAQLYGDYSRALAQDRQLQLSAQGQQYDLLTRLLGALS